MKMWMAAAAAASVMCAGPRVHASNVVSGPSEQDLAPAVRAFLADHGDLCLAWYTWPRELTVEQQRSGLNEAVQLPVLERLGLVKSSEVPASQPGADSGGLSRRYALTAKGQH
jgi:hypothetical protein